MQRNSMTILMLAALTAAGGAVSAATPTADALVSMAVDAAQTESDLDAHNMIRIAIHQEETTSDGKTTTKDHTAVFHGSHVENSRLVLGSGVSLALSGKNGWAMVRGEIDSRPQAPKMAAGTIRQTIFPLVMPFSLQIQGVHLGSVTAASFDGTPAWVLEINFEPNFFAAPVMNTTWRVFISREDNLVLGADFLPPQEFRSSFDEGVRYRILKRQNVEGIILPSHILMDGIDFNGAENGHVRVTKTTAETIDPLDLSLFINPEAAERMDAGEIF